MEDIMEIHKTCSFFGHRKVKITEELKHRLKELLEDLIVNNEVTMFLFGSRSNFYYICHSVVDELKVKYPSIKRILYSCPSDGCTLESERKEMDGYCFDKEYEYEAKYIAGRASYVERNRAMINDSDYCVFYYDENYKPQLRKYAKNCVSYYQPKSGTALAYKYAKQKKKSVVNVISPKG